MAASGGAGLANRAVIVGAGEAGAQGAISLRQAGFKGEIIMLGAETAPPYQRPPLSKAYLKGELTQERLYLRPAAFYEKQDITLRLGERARHIDRAGQKVVTEKEEAISNDRLLLATGAPPRHLHAPAPISTASTIYARFRTRTPCGRSSPAKDAS